MVQEKTCCCCKETKPVSEFYTDKNRKDGLYRRCKTCHSVSVMKWQQKDGGIRHLENCRRYHANNVDREREVLRAWRLRNRDQHLDTARKWKAKNSMSLYARNKERTASLKRATPRWADRDKIMVTYAAREAMRKLTGFDWHVDHIIPLHGKLVSGLHVAENLRIVPASVNLKKNNLFFIE